jgi:hypothetical protein
MITPQKKVLIGILITGIITATITTLAVTNVLNSAAAQIQVPFQGQPRLPQQQQPSAATTPTTSTSSGSFGPSCVGCVTTQNLANGAVTNPKLAVPSVSTANIGAGQVATGNIANGAVTTAKIAAGAVRITTADVFGPDISIAPGEIGTTRANCPTGTVVTGGGYVSHNPQVHAFISLGQKAETGDPADHWSIEAINPSPGDADLTAHAICTTIQP